MQNGYTALMHAASNNHTDIVKYLVEEAKAQVNVTNNVSQNISRNFLDYPVHSMCKD